MQGCVHCEGQNTTEFQPSKMAVVVARLNLPSYSKIKGSLFFKMFIYMYKKDFSKKNIFFFALTGRPEAIYFAL